MKSLGFVWLLCPKSPSVLSCSALGESWKKFGCCQWGRRAGVLPGSASWVLGVWANRKEMFLPSLGQKYWPSCVSREGPQWKGACSAVSLWYKEPLRMFFQAIVSPHLCHWPHELTWKWWGIEGRCDVNLQLVSAGTKPPLRGREMQCFGLAPSAMHTAYLRVLNFLISAKGTLVGQSQRSLCCLCYACLVGKQQNESLELSIQRLHQHWSPWKRCF